MQWKKAIAAGALGALMAGSTLGFAQALNNFPAPFVVGGTVNALVVVGATAATADVAGAIDVAARLGGSAVTKETVSVPGVAGVVQVVGEGREIGTKTQPIFLGTNLAKNGLRSTMTDADLPTLLASGTLEDTDANDEYDFDQFIKFSDDFPLIYSRISGEEADPSYKFGEFGTSPTATNFFYQAQVVFTKEVNMSTAKSEDLDIFGGSYTISPDTTSVCTPGTASLVLFGASDKRLLREGESVTVTIGGKTHTIALLVVSDQDTVAVQVDGQSKSLDKGQSTTIGGVSIFVDDVFFSAKEAVASSAEIGIGAREITFKDDNQVEVGIGGDTDFIDGSLVDLTCSAGKLTKIDIYVTAPSSQGDFLKEGGTFLDPVFGTFSVAFPTVLPAISDTANREEILVTPSGTNNIDVTMTNDRGDRKAIKWVFANNTASSTGDLILADDNGDIINVVEGAPMTRDDYFVADAGDFSRMFEITSVSALGTSAAELRIRDVFSGNTIDIDLGADNAAEKVIDGQSYFFNVTGTTANPVISVTWGSGPADLQSEPVDPAFNADPGTYTTVYPKIKTKLNDEGVAFLRDVSISGLDASTAYLINLPTGAIGVSVDGTAGNATITANTTEDSESTVLTSLIGSTTINNIGGLSARVGRTATGGAFYVFNWTDDGASGTLRIRPATAAGAPINDPVLLLIEEENDDGNVGTVAFEADWNDAEDETEVGAPVISVTGGASSFSGTREADTDITRYVSRWGTWIERDTEDQNRVKVWYPDEEVSAAVFILGEGASTTTTGGAAATTVTSDKVVPIKSALGKLDSEVTDADKANKNLILVGGPAVNTLVADLAAAGKTWTLSMWRDGTRSNTAIIQVVGNAFATGRVALIAAGHEAPDTRAATSILQKYDDFAALTGTGVIIKNGVITGPL